MEEDEPLDPMAIGPVGPAAVMTGPEGFAKPVEELGFRGAYRGGVASGRAPTGAPWRCGRTLKLPPYHGMIHGDPRPTRNERGQSKHNLIPPLQPVEASEECIISDAAPGGILTLRHAQGERSMGGQVFHFLR